MQSEERNTVCRLCLKPRECTSEYVEAITREILVVFGLELNLDISGSPVICSTCLEIVQKCFDFKKVCLYTEYFITSLKSDIKLDLQEIYVRKNENKDATLSQCYTLCRLCMEIAEADGYIALNDEAKGTISTKTILERCFPELDLDVTKDPKICTSCNESLISYFNFVNICLDMKDKIKKYCEIEESNNKSEEEPEIALRFSAENIANYENGCTALNIPEKCDENELRVEIKLEAKNLAQKEHQVLHIKLEVNEHDEVDDSNVEKLSNAFEKCHEIKQNGETELKCENVESESCRFNVKLEETDTESEGELSDPLGFQDGMLIFKDASAVDVHHCRICKFETRYKGVLKQHMLMHKNDSQATIYSCEICTHESEQKDDLERHILNHKMYSCGMCTYESTQRDVLKRHMLIHNDISEVTLYLCEICAYKSKQKDVFKRHMLMHKNYSDVTIYSCEICTYKATREEVLKQHMSRHKIASEATIHSCGICAHKTKHKSALKKHMLIHKNPSEVTMHPCEICTYKTKHKGSLTSHMMIHKNTSEVTMYSCGICTFQTKRKYNLVQHNKLIHKSTAEVTTYSCEICTYVSKQKHHLEQHMLVHKNASEVTLYSCELCTLKTKRKSDLKRHMLIHKNASEVAMYSCGICGFQTKRKNNLKQHNTLLHKSANEVTMYSCGICTYKTKLKGVLKQHMLIHKDASEVTMYACGICTFQTKYKRVLQQHMLRHKNSSEVTAYQSDMYVQGKKKSQF